MFTKRVCGGFLAGGVLVGGITVGWLGIDTASGSLRPSANAAASLTFAMTSSMTLTCNDDANVSADFFVQGPNGTFQTVTALKDAPCDAGQQVVPIPSSITIANAPSGIYEIGLEAFSQTPHGTNVGFYQSAQTSPPTVQSSTGMVVGLSAWQGSDVNPGLNNDQSVSTFVYNKKLLKFF
jgi:hypothetical protein